MYTTKYFIKTFKRRIGYTYNVNKCVYNNDRHLFDYPYYNFFYRITENT